MPNQNTGFLDLHSHLLPGIDDGCCNIKESLDCVRRLQQHGFVGTVCTPHVVFAQYPNNTPPKIEIWAEALRKQLAEAEINYQIWTGAEVRITDETYSWMQRHGVPTLGDGRCVLLDSWDAHWPEAGDQVMDWLLEEGYQPILAHPERMALDDDPLESLLDRLMNKRVWLQGNLNSLAGGEGNSARRRMQVWLEENRYSLIASDMHRPHHLDGRMHGVQLLFDAVGDEKATELLAARPRVILGEDK